MTKTERETLGALATALGMDPEADLDDVVGRAIDAATTGGAGAGDDEALGAALEGLAEAEAEIARLKADLAEASTPFDLDVPAFVVFRAQGRTSRGVVTVGMAASHARGDYTAEDLTKVAHVVADRRTYERAARHFGRRGEGVGSASHGATARSGAEARAISERKLAREASGSTIPRTAPLRANAKRGRAGVVATGAPMAPSPRTTKPRDADAPRLRSDPRKA